MLVKTSAYLLCYFFNTTSSHRYRFLRGLNFSLPPQLGKNSYLDLRHKNPPEFHPNHHDKLQL